MTDLPILFSPPMVRAQLAGTKTQTRRKAWKDADYDTGRRGWAPSRAQRIRPGDRLWVRESWRTWVTHNQTKPRDLPHGNRIEYMADREKVALGKARPGMFMPRWASRLTLEVMHTRIERLQDISAADASSEGRPICDQCGDCGWINSGPDGGRQCDAPDCGTSDIEWYAALWDSINGSGSWKANPDVVVLQFSVHLCNIDRMPTDG